MHFSFISMALACKTPSRLIPMGHLFGSIPCLNGILPVGWHWPVLCHYVVSLYAEPTALQPIDVLYESYHLHA